MPILMTHLQLIRRSFNSQYLASVKHIFLACNFTKSQLKELQISKNNLGSQTYGSTGVHGSGSTTVIITPSNPSATIFLVGGCPACRVYL